MKQQVVQQLTMTTVTQLDVTHRLQKVSGELTL